MCKVAQSTSISLSMRFFPNRLAFSCPFLGHVRDSPSSSSRKGSATDRTGPLIRPQWAVALMFSVHMFQVLV